MGKKIDVSHPLWELLLTDAPVEFLPHEGAEVFLKEEGFSLSWASPHFHHFFEIRVDLLNLQIQYLDYDAYDGNEDIIKVALIPEEILEELHTHRQAFL
jgi:hypothetical protein